MAIDCAWLKRGIDPSRRDPYSMRCTHIVREGEECVGPFLEDVETGCGLWTHGGPASTPRTSKLGSGRI